ncbi:Phytochrome-like protein cph2 [compost metagenome]
MGGDEFLFILPDLDGIIQSQLVADQILEQVNKPVKVQAHELFISASIGISLYPFDGDDIGNLVKNADTAMYVAKNQGRNGAQYYDSAMNAKAESNLKMEIKLRGALRQNEFKLYYQPKYDLKEGRITGMEALIRWQHPELGLVPPAEFIPLAEELGLLNPIGEWVLRTACEQNKKWQDEGVQALSISVNISASQFQHPDFLDTVKQILEETSLEPHYLELELTESVIMNNGSMAIVRLKKLKELGILISIDDFGTGFSSLSYLKYFPIDSLKIDRSFIKDIPDAPKDTAITKTILALGRRLNIKVVAEGVETEQQLAFLASRKCDEVQGYLISKPLPPDEAIRLLQKPVVSPIANESGWSSLH